LGLDWDADG
jgi:hypothetical protein